MNSVVGCILPELASPDPRRTTTEYQKICSRRGLNPRPVAHKTTTLTTELQEHRTDAPTFEQSVRYPRRANFTYIKIMLAPPSNLQPPRASSCLHSTRPWCVLRVLLKAFRCSCSLTLPLQIFLSFFKTLVGKEIAVELKNDVVLTGTLHSVDQYLNVKLLNVRVVQPEKYPQLTALKNCFVRGSVVRYIQIPPEFVDTELLQDAARKENAPPSVKAKA